MQQEKEEQFRLFRGVLIFLILKVMLFFNVLFVIVINVILVVISLMPVENGFSKKAFIPHFPGLERAEDFAIQNPCLDGISHKRDDMSPNDSNAPRAAGKTPTGQRKRKRWTDQEVDFLLEGVRLFGVGNWKDIQNHFQFGDRSYVDLKDKYRNLLKHYTTDELLGKTDSLLRPR